jgi:predicted heme/steroid binding protein/uncharacterized membrane protein
MMTFPRSSLQRLFLFLGAALVLLSAPSPSSATPEYARQTGLECGRCHIDAMGGGPLTDEGSRYLAGLKARGEFRSLTLAQHLIRLIIGYVHLLAAIVWFGTIMYVHVLLKPAYASKGLPKGELRLGWISMIALLITGVLLTIARMPSWSAFISTRFGILLSIKITLYLFMLGSAVVVTTYIGPRLRKRIAAPSQRPSGPLTPDELRQFDGKDGRPAYIGYKGIVYDVTASRLWKNGLHVMKHGAGNDLTAFIQNAPHGEDKVLTLPRIAELQTGAAPAARPFHERLFYFFAYMNLALVFVITFIIALWRWW